MIEMRHNFMDKSCPKHIEHKQTHFVLILIIVNIKPTTIIHHL